MISASLGGTAGLVAALPIDVTMWRPIPAGRDVRPLNNHLQMMRCEAGIVNEMEFRMSRARKWLSP
jgi:hypothetical protein